MWRQAPGDVRDLRQRPSASPGPPASTSLEGDGSTVPDPQGAARWAVSNARAGAAGGCDAARMTAQGRLAGRLRRIPWILGGGDLT